VQTRTQADPQQRPPASREGAEFESSKFST
jgi:hypothetical protein